MALIITTLCMLFNFWLAILVFREKQNPKVEWLLVGLMALMCVVGFTALIFDFTQKGII